MGVLWHNWPKLISALQPETPTGSTFLPFLTVSSWSGLCVCTTVVLWSMQRLLLIVFLMLCSAVMPKAYLLSAVLVHARGGIFSVMWWCSQLRPFYLHMTKILEKKKPGSGPGFRHHFGTKNTENCGHSQLCPSGCPSDFDTIYTIGWWWWWWRR